MAKANLDELRDLFNTEASFDAFVNWWRACEAEGYQYGYEALTNVAFGFDAAFTICTERS